jgi:hypothetical protein
MYPRVGFEQFFYSFNVLDEHVLHIQTVQLFVSEIDPKAQVMLVTRH